MCSDYSTVRGSVNTEARLAERTRTTLKVTENYQKKLHKSDTKVKKSKYKKIHKTKIQKF